jgi:hypothetical protein
MFAAASLFAAPECADGRALTGIANVYAFSLIFYKFIVDKASQRADVPATLIGTDGATAVREFLVACCGRIARDAADTD